MKEIPLTQGKVALVDDEDFERLSRHKWHAAKDNHTWYAQGRFFIEPGVVRSLKTHRELLGLKEGDGREGDPTVPSRDCANPGSCPLFDKGSCYVLPGAPCAKPLSLYSAEN